MTGKDVQARLRELAQRGVGFDMNPTMMFTTAESMYSQWLDYFTRLDQAWRDRVDEIASALSTPPADDVREALIDELTATVAWMKRTRNYIDAGRVMRAIARIREVSPHGTVTPPAEDVTDPNSGEGWYAWQHMPANTSHIAYVRENGEVYLPESPGDTEEPFLLAAAAGHVHRLVRADEVRPHGTVTDASVEQLREARAEAWDEAVAAVFAWWKATEGERPLAIVNPYGVGLGDDGAAREVHP